MRPELPSRTVDRLIGWLADRQHGVVARWQLLEGGVGEGAIKARIASGRLRRVHRGVYLVGHRATSPLAMEAAAVLACHGNAVVSHRSAAKLHGILPYPAQADVWITVTAGDHRGSSGLLVRTSTHLDARDVTRVARIPATAPARTILDLAAVVDGERLEQACAEAHALGLAQKTDLRDQLARNPGRRGAGRLRRLLDRAEAPARTRSPLERRFLRLVRDSDLPNPETDRRIGPYVVDFVWREQALIVETDGRAYHSHDRAERRDRARTRALQLRGYSVLRFTWEEVAHRPAWVLREVRAALALRRAR